MSIPLTVFMAWLTTKYKTEWILIISDFIVILGGVFMIIHTPQAGSWQFISSYLVSQIFDASNFVLTQTMMMSKLKDESRGVIMSFNNMCF
jgi:hypothetical protein